MIRIYADKDFVKTIETIEWDNKKIIELITKEEVILKNTAEAGELAEAKFYIRNEGIYPSFITEILLSESRLDWKIDKGQLSPNDFAEVTISFKVPENITPKDVIKAGTISIEGYYVYVG